jgi:flagellar hook assembly protein FlgD
VFPNPIDFGQTGVDKSGHTINDYCSGLYGCIKFNGVEKGSTLKIYTVALSLVRTFHANDYLPLAGGNPNVVQITWDGTNENRNPVAAGMYFYVMDGGPSGKQIGKLAIKGARK